MVETYKSPQNLLFTGVLTVNAIQVNKCRNVHEKVV